MREKWLEEDEKLYANKIDHEVVEEKIKSLESKVGKLQKQILKETDIATKRQNDVYTKFEQFSASLELQKQTQKDELEMVVQQSNDFENKLEEQTQQMTRKITNQFDDFMLKVDGELTRRNRLRIETFSKFDQHEAMLQKLQ